MYGRHMIAPFKLHSNVITAGTLPLNDSNVPVSVMIRLRNDPSRNVSA
jgi:hypothetical protein